jgi:hypothetical protein
MVISCLHAMDISICYLYVYYMETFIESFFHSPMLKTETNSTDLDSPF